MGFRQCIRGAQGHAEAQQVREHPVQQARAQRLGTGRDRLQATPGGGADAVLEPDGEQPFLDAQLAGSLFNTISL